MVFVFLYHWFAIQRSYYLVKSNVFQNKKSQHPYLMTLFVSVFLFSRVLSQLVRTMLSDHPLRGPFHVTICKALLMWALADLQCCQQRRSSEGGEWMCLCMCACMGDAYMIACVCLCVCVCCFVFLCGACVQVEVGKHPIWKTKRATVYYCHTQSVALREKCLFCCPAVDTFPFHDTICIGLL